MKKIFCLLLAIAMMASLLAGCGSTADAPAETQAPTQPAATEAPAVEETEAPAVEEGTRTADPNKQKIVFGITASFEHFTSYIPEMMAQWGYEVEFVILDSAVVANVALTEGSIDVNYVQHLPYLLAYNESNGTDLHPMDPYIMASMDCLVSMKYTSIDEIPDGASIAIADDASNLSVNLEDLASIGLITLAEIPEGSLYTTFDIIDNPKNLKLVEMDMFSRYSALNGDVDLAMSFFTNSAQERYGFNLLKLFDENVAFPQVIAVRNEDKDAQWVQDFVAAFTSQTQIDKINEKNIPEMAWKILFEASDAEMPAAEVEEETVRTADPNKQKIVFGITASFEHFTSYIPEMMAQWGYEVEFVILDSAVVANVALTEGSIDVNYVQHLPYLLAYNESNGTTLHPMEPYIMASMDCLVSMKYTSIDEIPDGASIAIADDASNLSVNLEDLASIGLITLAEIPEGSLYTTFDIIDNPKNLKLVEMDMFSRYSALNGDVDLAMSFFTNSAQERYGFNLLKLFDENIAFPQVIAVRNEDKDAQWVQDFVAAFTSQTQIDKINEKNIPEMAWKILFEASDAK